MQITFTDVFITEGNLQEVATEDGLGYYPDLQVVARNTAGEYLIHPHFFKGTASALIEAEELLYKILERTTIDTDIWIKVDQNEYRYSDGNNEPYDSEEEFYMNSCI